MNLAKICELFYATIQSFINTRVMSKNIFHFCYKKPFYFRLSASDSVMASHFSTNNLAAQLHPAIQDYNYLDLFYPARSASYGCPQRPQDAARRPLASIETAKRSFQAELCPFFSLGQDIQKSCANSGNKRRCSSAVNLLAKKDPQNIYNKTNHIHNYHLPF